MLGLRLLGHEGCLLLCRFWLNYYFLDAVLILIVKLQVAIGGVVDLWVFKPCDRLVVEHHAQSRRALRIDVVYVQ